MNGLINGGTGSLKRKIKTPFQNELQYAVLLEIRFSNTGF